jgi:hypothetical protein
VVRERLFGEGGGDGCLFIRSSTWHPALLAETMVVIVACKKGRNDVISVMKSIFRRFLRE